MALDKPKQWSDTSILKSIKNTCKGHIHTIMTNELTFHGFPNQPDYAKLTIKINPRERCIELKSFKEYLFQFRTTHISYEHLLNIIFDDIKNIYDPHWLSVTIETSPRGGISSVLKKES